MDAQYRPDQVEAQAQQYWEDNQSFKVTEEAGKEKFYCLSMFPYRPGDYTWATCVTTASAM